eukprot:gene1465-12084_t
MKNQKDEVKEKNKIEKPKKIEKETSEPGFSIFVGNLNLKKKTKKKDFMNHFKDCGEITKIEVEKKKDVFTGKAVVHFTTMESVKKAVKLTNTKLNGKKIRVDANVEGSKKIIKNLKKNQIIEHMIHVSNFTFETTRFELEDLFNQVGKIISINMPANKNGRPSGSAFIEFEETSSVEKAIQTFDGKKLNGRKLFVRKKLNKNLKKEEKNFDKKSNGGDFQKNENFEKKRKRDDGNSFKNKKKKF